MNRFGKHEWMSGWVALALLAITAGAARAESIEELRKAALEASVERSEAALAKLGGMGRPGQLAARAAAREILLRDRVLIRRVGERGLGIDEKRLTALEKELEEARKAARKNLEDLERDSAGKEAFAHFKQLHGLVKDTSEMYAAKAAVYDAAVRRGKLLRTYRELGAADVESVFKPADEEALAKQAGKALGGLDRMREGMEVGDGKGPNDPALKGLWFWRVCRRIEAYNAGFEPLMDAYEVKCARLLDVYRECLGLWPLEIDARLIQAARRHSREMAEKNYFSHTSPTKGSERSVDRMRLAGYAAGRGENIALGGSEPLWTFWMWFYSPGHHENMVRATTTTVGYGRWGKYWTQNFGRGRRLMLASEEDRGAVKVMGDELPPKVTEDDRKRVNWALREGMEFFDPLAGMTSALHSPGM